jgi:hypothetical protein
MESIDPTPANYELRFSVSPAKKKIPSKKIKQNKNNFMDK